MPQFLSPQLIMGSYKSLVGLVRGCGQFLYCLKPSANISNHGQAFLNQLIDIFQLYLLKASCCLHPSYLSLPVGLVASLFCMLVNALPIARNTVPLSIDLPSLPSIPSWTIFYCCLCSSTARLSPPYPSLIGCSLVHRRRQTSHVFLPTSAFWRLPKTTKQGRTLPLSSLSSSSSHHTPLPFLHIHFHFLSFLPFFYFIHSFALYLSKAYTTFFTNTASMSDYVDPYAATSDPVGSAEDAAFQGPLLDEPQDLFDSELLGHSREERDKILAVSGWVHPKDLADSPDDANPDWFGNAVCYDWDDTFGEVGPRNPELEVQLYQNPDCIRPDNDTPLLTLGMAKITRGEELAPFAKVCYTYSLTQSTSIC